MQFACCRSGSYGHGFGSSLTGVVGLLLYDFALELALAQLMALRAEPYLAEEVPFTIAIEHKLRRVVSPCLPNEDASYKCGRIVSSRLDLDQVAVALDVNQVVAGGIGLVSNYEIKWHRYPHRHAGLRLSGGCRRQDGGQGDGRKNRGSSLFHRILLPKCLAKGGVRPISFGAAPTCSQQYTRQNRTNSIKEREC